MVFASALVTCVNVQYIWHRAAVKARIFSVGNYSHHEAVERAATHSSIMLRSTRAREQHAKATPEPHCYPSTVIANKVNKQRG